MIKTLKFKSQSEWLKKRNLGVGGSDVAALLNVSPWSNRFKLWVQKTGQQKSEVIVNEAMNWGNKLEPLLLEEYAERTKHKVTKPKYMLYDDEHHMIGSFDGLCAKEKKGVEFKCVGTNAAKKWGNDAIPTEYYLQVQHYMHLSGMEAWDICPFFGSSMEIRTVARDEKVIGDIKSTSKKFWTEHVLPKVRPTPTDPMEELAMAEYLKGVAVTEKFLEGTNEDFLYLKKLLYDKSEQSKFDDEIEGIEVYFKNRVGESSGIVFPDGSKITWKRNKPSQVVRWEGLARALGATDNLISKYTEEKEGNRVFRVSEAKGEI